MSDRQLGAVEGEPLAVRAALTALIGGLLHVLILIVVPDNAAELEDAVVGLTDLIALAVLAWWARRSVTANARVAAIAPTGNVRDGAEAGPAAVQPDGTSVNLLASHHQQLG